MRLPGFLQRTNKAKGGAVQQRRALTSRLLDTWGYGRGLAHELDFGSLLRANRSWVYVCANKNVTTVAQQQLKVYAAMDEEQAAEGFAFIPPVRKLTTRQRTKLLRDPAVAQLPAVRKAVEIVEVPEHPFLDMMRAVNPFMSQFGLMEVTQLYLELCGNAYWYVIEDGGVPVEVWPLPPERVKVIPDRNEFISGYEYSVGMDSFKFEPRQVVHFKFPSATSVYYGRSPLAAISEAYNLNQHMDEYEKALFANMGRLEGAFETDAVLQDAEFNRLKKELEALYGGVANAGKSPLLDSGVHYKPFGFQPRELSHLQGRKWTQQLITNAYGQSLGMYDKDATRANAEAAVYTYMRDAVQPRLTRLEQTLNENLLLRYGDEVFVAFDSPVPEDRDYRLREIESHLKTGYTAINEERALDGLDEVEWGDVPILPGGMAPLGSKPAEGEQPPPGELPPGEEEPEEEEPLESGPFEDGAALSRFARVLAREVEARL